MQKRIKVSEYCDMLKLNKHQTYKFVDGGFITKLPSVIRAEKPNSKADGLVFLVVDEDKFKTAIELANSGTDRKGMLKELKDVPDSDHILELFAELKHEIMLLGPKFKKVLKLAEKAEQKYLELKTNTQ